MLLQPGETLVFVHMPKTAGSSFKLALQQYFGDTLISEFDAPLARNRLVRPLRAYYQWARNHGQRREGVRCIAGHFVALKYLGYHQSTLVTWVRDPIQRMISHYHFWRSRPQNKHKSKFRTQVIDETGHWNGFVFAPS